MDRSLDVMAARQMGHSFFILHHSDIQYSQKLWEQLRDVACNVNGMAGWNGGLESVSYYFKQNIMKV